MLSLTQKLVRPTADRITIQCKTATQSKQFFPSLGSACIWVGCLTCKSDAQIGKGSVVVVLRVQFRTMACLVGHAVAADRDHATAAAAALCVANGANIIRAHNLRAATDAARVADAVTTRGPGRHCLQ